MSSTPPIVSRTYLERRVFAHFLRTGRRVDVDALAEACERKFNPYHDPADGRFTFKPGGGSLAPLRDTRPAKPNGAVAQPLPPVPKPKTPSSGDSKPEVDAAAKRQRDIGALAAKYESRKLEGPGTISSGKNDPGGVSYGTFQMSSNRGKIHEFVASPEAGPWAARFRGRAPVTKDFDDEWRAIAAQDPAAFETAQRAFIVRTNYSQGAEKVRRETGYDLDKASPAVRQAFFSTAVQHGATGGGGLFSSSVQAVDSKLKRADPGYESSLINALYDYRTTQRRNFARSLKSRADKLTRLGRSGDATKLLEKARLADNDIERRYPRERYDALLILSGRSISKL